MNNLSQVLSASIEQNSASGWNAECISQLVNASAKDSSIDLGFVDGQGAAMSTLDATTWGISLASCRAHCDSVPYFQLADFAGSFTNWLLPWLGLMAQLPFETDNAWENLMSLFLAIGSPFFAAYSLTIAIMNRMWLRSHYARIRNRTHPDQRLHLKNIFDVLCETQQVPMRTTLVSARLYDLVVHQRNWWIDVDDRLQHTRRAWTFSFWAQTVAAIAAWVLTVTGSIASLLGNDKTALDLSASSLWLWMLPLVLGWVSIGTQISPSTVFDTFNKIKISAGNRDVTKGTESANSSQKAIAVRTNQWTPLDWEDHDPHLLASWHGLSVRGDEASPGPIFKYARIWTWRQFCVEVMEQWLARPAQPTPKHAYDEFTAANERSDSNAGQPTIAEPDGSSLLPVTSSLRPESIQERQNIRPDSHARTESRQTTHLLAPDPDMEDVPLNNLAPQQARSTQGGDPVDNNASNTTLQNPKQRPVARRTAVPRKTYGRLQDRSDPEHLSNDPDIARIFIVASLIGCVLQWCTTGPSILIAYNTPTVGLGCSSGSYLLYGVAATIAWACLALSQLLSHQATTSANRATVVPEALDSAGSAIGSGINQLEHFARPIRQPTSAYPKRRTVGLSFLRGTAVVTRLAGKTLAVLNGCWLIVASLFEIIGFYNNCTCKSLEFFLHDKGWVVLFKSNAQLATAAQSFWAGGIAWMTISTIAIAVFFRSGSQSSFK